MAWIESHQELARNPKLGRFARTLQINKPTAIGHLHAFWWWVAEQHADGVLSATEDRAIAIAAMWDGAPGEFIGALERAGFIDAAPGGYTVHNWMRYSGKAIKRQREDAQRWNTEYQALRLQVIARDGLVCQLCGQPLDLSGIDVDHIIPRSKGGPDTLDNLRVAHPFCNRSRGNRETWVPR